MKQPLLRILCLMLLCNAVWAENLSLNDRLAEAAKTHSYTISFENGKFSGSGWDFLINAGMRSQFFLLGEEHGIAENPKLASALFKALVSSGYKFFAVETSPQMAEAMEKAAKSGIDGLKQLFKDGQSKVAFFGMREEAQMIVDIAQTLTGAKGYLWGLDYEVLADRHLISTLESKNKNKLAKLKLKELRKASNESWSKYHESKNPGYIFSFSGDPELIRSLRKTWKNADDEAQGIMNTLEKTLNINQLYIQGKAWDSNKLRADLIKQNFINYWNFKEKNTKVFFKMGASHLIRGRSHTEVYDIGNLIPELAILNGNKSFNVMILQGNGSSTAVFDPTELKYIKGPPKDKYSDGLKVLTEQVSQGSFTLIDLRPLRAIMSWNNTENVKLNQVIHGYDALLVMTDSTASSDLFESTK
ncbi:MAG: hypothetical protein KDI92_11180 [Xanthomonadales bacterium]|nr:hypothetical protein [Xanthomonadales bacterium]